MSLLPLLLLAASTYAEDLISSTSTVYSYDAVRSETCVRRSVFVYTASSSTYVVTNLGSLDAAPTFCANVSTLTLPGSTETVTTTTGAAASTRTVIADYDFEDGSVDDYQTSATGPEVTAEVAGIGAPIAPYNGNSFLLITFNAGSQPPPRLVKRQLSEPLVYNVTQQFSTTAGETYNLRAYASEAQLGDVDAECSIKICVSGSCGPSTALSTEYSPYTYLYNADSEERSAVAIFSVECPASAYVALDSVRVASADPADDGPETITRYITRTATPSAGQVVTTTAIQRPDVSTKFITDTTTVVNLEWTSKILSFENTMTATMTTTRAGATEFVNQTVEGTTTTTTTLTRYANRTTTINVGPGSVDIQTAFTTIDKTVTLPGVTLPRETFTPLPETTYLTVTLPASTITSIISVTPPPVTEFQTRSLTLPAITESLTLPAITESLTLPALTESLTLPRETYTERLTERITETTMLPTEQISDYIPETTSEPPIPDVTTSEPPIESPPPEEPTIYVPPPPSGVPAIALANPTAIVGDINGSPDGHDDEVFEVVLPFQISLYDQFSSLVRVSSNAILSVGAALNYEFSNTALPYFGDSGCEEEPVYVDETTGISYPRCFGDTLALGFWDDLYIYEGTQQGIYYDVVGSVGARTALFEFYIGSYHGTDQYYHFVMSFYEARPNVVEYHYLNVSDHGIGATVGVESKSAGGKFLQYSNNQPVVCPGMVIMFDTNSGNANGYYNIDIAGDCTAEIVGNDDDDSDDGDGDDGDEGEGIPGGRLVSRPKKNVKYGPNRERS